ncbi:MAG: hypothetical protein COW34_10965, partial [Armatimonadetes bacterium CG17_big_fil_post_rev_8_21_14_2_50_66_6]
MAERWGDSQGQDREGQGREKRRQDWGLREEEGVRGRLTSGETGRALSVSGEQRMVRVCRGEGTAQAHSGAAIRIGTTDVGRSSAAQE